jgi:hypothetical protein
MPDRTESDDPKEWMLRAFSNLNLAKSQQSGVFLEDLCFNAQQAVSSPILIIASDTRLNLGEKSQFHVKCS